MEHLLCWPWMVGYITIDQSSDANVRLISELKSIVEDDLSIMLSIHICSLI